MLLTKMLRLILGIADTAFRTEQFCITGVDDDALPAVHTGVSSKFYTKYNERHRFSKETILLQQGRRSEEGWGKGRHCEVRGREGRRAVER